MKGRLALLGATLALAMLAKLAYRGAAVDDLRFVMAPTAAAVGAALGERFTFEPGFGYVSPRLHYAIVASCSGVNFLIVAACSLAWTWRGRAATPGRALGVLAASTAAAYALTVLANTTRLSAAVLLHAGEVAWGPLTPDRLHRALGTVVYLLALLAAVELAARMGSSRHVPT